VTISAATRRLASRLALVLVGAILALVILGAGVLLLLHLFFSKPSEHNNPSFRYGEKVLDSIYGSMRGSVTEACKAAISQRSDHPEQFDLGEAVAGCKYQEWIYDN
jgi:hypothetical protein